jgi:hypothetical protein
MKKMGGGSTLESTRRYAAPFHAVDAAAFGAIPATRVR